MKLVWIVCLLVGQAALVRAQPAPAGETPGPLPLSESLQGEAKTEYESARILFGDDDFAGASVKFQRAFEASGDVRLLWNVAVCEKNLRHYVKVLRLLERYQREGNELITPAHRREVRDVLKTVRQLISTIHLTVQPAPAEIFVDDLLVTRAPLSEPLLVDLGMRRIRISKPGYREYAFAQNFAGGSELTLDVDLLPEIHAGRISVSAAAGDTISLDGTIVGQGQWHGTVESGEHVIRVTAPGKRPYSRELVIQDKQQRSLFVSLEAERTSISPLIWVGAGVLVAGGLATGAYFLLRPTPAPQYKVGTWDPGAIDIP